MNIDRKPLSRKSIAWTVGYWLVILLTALIYLHGNSGGNGTGGTGHGGIGLGPGAGPAGTGPGAGKEGQGIGRNAGDGNGGTGETAPAAPVPAATVPGTAKKGSPESRSTTAGGVDAPAEQPATVEGPLRELGTGEKRKPAAVSAAGGKKSGFFGVEVAENRRVLFLLDVSSSMQSSASEGLSRLELLKRELKKVMAEMHRKARRGTGKGRGFSDHLGNTFRIVTFSSDTVFLPPATEKALRFQHSGDVARAEQTVEKLSAGGCTEMQAAWRALEPVLKKDQTDAVYFLSDGEPTDCRPDELIALLKQKYPKLIINTFSMGCRSQLLKQIADEHRGKAVEIY